VGPRAGLDGRNMSYPTGFDAGPCSPKSVAIPTELPSPRLCVYIYIYIYIYIYTTFNILVCIPEFVGDLSELMVCPNTILLPLALRDYNVDGGRHIFKSLELKEQPSATGTATS